MNDDFEAEQRGQNADSLLKNPLLKKSLAAVRDAVIEEWADTRSEEGREYLWRLHRASVKFEEVLLGYIQQGEIVKANLKPDQGFLRSIL
jgi:hypothetical protein